MNNKEGAPSWINLKKDIKKEQTKDKEQQEEERILEERKELTEKEEATRERSAVLEKERLNKRQEIFPPQKEWNELLNTHQTTLKVYLYGREMKKDEIVVVIGKKKGEVLQARVEEIVGEAKDGATLIKIKV